MTLFSTSLLVDVTLLVFRTLLLSLLMYYNG